MDTTKQQCSGKIKTAFFYGYGAFKFTTMILGHKSAPAHFKHSINLILHDLLDDRVLVYLDDNLIYTKTKEEHQ